MRLSRYDADGDGRCDDPACEALRAIPLLVEPFISHPDLMQEYLEPLGIRLVWEQYDNRPDLFEVLDDPGRQFPAFVVGMGISSDLDAGSYFSTLFTPSGIESFFNYSMLGADAQQLADRGYSVNEVPSADDRIEACIPQVGAERSECWARVDQYLTQEVVPWVPYLFESYTRTVSARVVAGSYSFDQSVGLPALDHLAVQSNP